MLEKGDEPVPGYCLEAFLGRGQFGEVWRATSPGGAQVALKFLNLHERHGLKEFRAIQRIKMIRHPHLASVTALWLLDEEGNVLDDNAVESYASSPAMSNRDTLVPSGTVESDWAPHRLVVATLLCDKNLLDRLTECQAQGSDGIPVDELLRYMEEAAKGIDFLNSQRHNLVEGPVSIQHCDIKPANIMLTGDSVMICDFGVAAFLSNAHVAATGTSMAGSPAYMSPECAVRKPSAASDQYSLAVTYTELRTGQLPFSCASWIEVIEAHRSGNLDLSRLPLGEQAIVRKATSVDAEDRYPSAVAMVRALQRAVEPADQKAPKTNPLRTFAKVAASLVLLAAIGWGAVHFLPWGNREQTQLDGGGSVTSETTVNFHVVPVDSEVMVDGISVEPDAEGRVSVTREPNAKVDIQVRKPPQYLEARQQLTIAELSAQLYIIQLDRDREYLQQLAQMHASRAFDMIDSDQPHLPDLDRAANEYQRAMELEEARYAVVPPFVRSLCDAEQEYSFTIRCMAIHPEKPWLVARFEGTKIALWNLAELEAPQLVLHEHGSHVCNVLTAGPYVASADLTGQIKLTRLDQDGRPQETQHPSELSGMELAITPDLHWLIAGDYEGNVLGWNLDASGAGNSSVPLGKHTQSVRGIVVTPDSQWVLTAGEDGTVCKWSLQAPNPAAVDARLGSQPGDVFALAISPDGRWVALGGEAKSGLEFPVSRADLTQNTMGTLPQGHTAPISALAYNRSDQPEQTDMAMLAIGSEDGQIQVYDTDSPRSLNSHHTAAIKSLTFCLAADWLISGSDDGTIGLWDLQHADHKPLVLDGHSGRVVQLLVTPRWLIAAYYNGAILLWDLRRCILVKRAAGEQGIDVSDESGDPGTIKT